jgi:cytochrome b subunit of formate dehydrogenase
MSVTSVQASAAAQAVPERVRRHRLIDRLYHWAMAVCVLTLMGTAFLPIVGIKFEWLTIHWTTGLVLTALVLFHIVRATIWQHLSRMMIDLSDIRNGWRSFTRLFGAAARPGKQGKYNAAQKLYHAGAAVLVLALVASGFLMLLKIDTPWWRRDPYLLADDTWGLIYVVHDFAAMALVTLVMIHIYFAVRPDEWWASRAMFRGWITRREYDAHCDRARWQADDA